MALFRSFKHLPFTFLWSGQTISRLGDSLYRIALAWWVLEKTGSAAIMGTVMIFSFTPMLIFMLIGGVAVDRYSRVKVMILSDVLRGLAVLIVAALAFTGLLEVWHIYIASILFGLVDAFFQPAYTAVVPQITPRELLPSANSLTSLSGQFANIAGPALGAALVVMGGTAFSFALDGLSFFLSAALLLPLLKLPKPPQVETEKQSMLQDIKVGFKAVLSSTWLWLTIAMAALGNVFYSGPISVSLPFLVKTNLGGNVNALGWILSATAIGSVLGAIWFGRYTRLRKRGLIAYGGWIVSGLMMMVYGLPVPLAVILLAALVNGIGNTTSGLIWVNTLQEMVPGDLLGRVSSIDMIGSFVLLPVGYGLAGVFTDQFGAPLVFVIGGVVSALLAAGCLFSPAIRNLD